MSESEEQRELSAKGYARQYQWRTQSRALRRWSIQGQGAPYSDLSCQDFKAQKSAIWNLIKQTATNNAKKPAVKSAVATMIADIESWDANKNRTYILYAHAGSYGVAVVNFAGFEVAKHATLNYCLSDMSTNNIGVCLIEQTVNLSQREGKDGKVCLIAKSDFLETLYAKYGFIINTPANIMDGAIMTLDPNDKTKGGTHWVRTRSRWVFVPYNG